jgi:hypothetical protein
MMASTSDSEGRVDDDDGGALAALAPPDSGMA